MFPPHEDILRKCHVDIDRRCQEGTEGNEDAHFSGAGKVFLSRLSSEADGLVRHSNGFLEILPRGKTAERSATFRLVLIGSTPFHAVARNSYSRWKISSVKLSLSKGILCLSGDAEVKFEKTNRFPRGSFFLFFFFSNFIISQHTNDEIQTETATLWCWTTNRTISFTSTV